MLRAILALEQLKPPGAAFITLTEKALVLLLMDMPLGAVALESNEIEIHDLEAQVIASR